ncbi:hypothetical protein PHYC_01585 [Phycisphaerales bacterium]|nr:hypothetical protein PHYC_01585 [Phycisphaerales bacterium]
MNARKQHMASGVIAATLAAVLTGSAFAQPEAEPNNSIGTAGSPTAVPCTRTGMISPTNDIDYYAITVPQGASLRIRAIPTSHTCTTSDLMVGLYNPAGMLIALNDDAPGMNLCPELIPNRDPEVAYLPAGTYHVSVVNINSAINVAYQMVVEPVDMPQPLSPVFTYQGMLRENGTEVNGTRDFTVTLWNHATAAQPGNRVGSPVHIAGVNVANGLFTLPLNFGDVFDGWERYAQVQVAEAGQGPGGTTVGPRQRLTMTPYAGYAMTAGAAGSAPWNGITGVPAAFADGQDNTGPWSLTGTTAWFSGGSVAIGASNAGGFMLAVAGTAAKNGGGSWSVFCDSRLKHDIKPLSGTLDRLLGLRGYTFEYNTDAVLKRLAMPGTQIGLMAEEVERVFPDWVETDSEGYRYVTERATTALMVEALRDLRAEKDAAVAEIEGLKSANAALEARLRRLEERLPK